MMHLSTFYHFVQTGGWKNITTYLYQDILCNVEKGWFSLVEDRERNWPFWSLVIFLFGRNGQGVVSPALAHCILPSRSYPTE